MDMNTNRKQTLINRPTSTKQKVLSSMLAVGVFFGIGGLIATRAADSASTVAAGGSASTGSVQAVSFSKKYNAAPTKKTTVTHATTKASKG